MIPRLRSNLPLFETAIVASLLGVGWALFHVYDTLEELARRPPPSPPRPEARQVARLSSLVALREHYVVLANEASAGLRGIREGLEDYVQDRSVSVALKRYFRETENLQRQLTETGRLFTAGTARQPPGDLAAVLGLDAAGAGAADLHPAQLLSQLIVGVSNYVAALNIGETTPLTPDIVQRKLSQARNEEAAVFALATGARARAGRIDVLLERRAVDLVTPAAMSSNPMALAAEFQLTNEVTLRLLAGVFLLLSIVLFVSIHRRLVVVPMHQHIIENTALAEYQRKLDHFAQVATGLAHEIRNPLTAISIRLFTLQKSLPPGGSQHSDATLIRGETDRLEQIVKNFLRLARPSEPKLAQLTARPLLEETRNLLFEQYRRRGVDLRLDTTTDTAFMGDAAQLKQVLINLVQNAAESISGSGRVILRAYDSRGEKAGGRAPGQRQVVLEIEDTGDGIPPEVQERLFDPFFSTKENGTGLGLPIAAKIVDQHAGRMEFESRVGDGTAFRVILPTASEK